MQLPISTKKRLYGSIPCIDWSNPLASNLLSAYLPGTTLGRDLVGTSHLTLQGSQIFQTNSEGTAMNISGIAGGLMGPASPQIITASQNALSIFWHGAILPGAPNQFAVAAGISYDAAGSPPYSVFELQAGGGSNWNDVRLAINDGTTERTFSGLGVGFTANIPTSFSGSLGFASGIATVSGYRDGNRVVGPSTQAGSAPASNSPQIGIGWFPNFGQISQTSSSVVYYFNRVLTDSEHATLHQDPFSLLTWPEDSVFSTLVGTSIADVLWAQSWM